MNDQPTTPPDEPEDATGGEPGEESGAGYGNHSPAPGEGSSEEDGDAG